MKKKVVYLLGAGRSGTTIMATVLGGNPQIVTIGEMHQFLDHVVEDKNCSCGVKMIDCTFWQRIISQLNISPEELKDWCLKSNNKEKHRNIPYLMSSQKEDIEYLNIHETIFNLIYSCTSNSKYLLDSSKYIARYLLLRKSKQMSVKGIFVVRDVRGVINSFMKKVQTSRSPISTIFYYTLINFFGQIVCWSDKNVIKVRYEDFVENTNDVLEMIYKHLEMDDSTKGYNSEEFEIPHIVGGNRLKHQSKITIRKDEKWKENIVRHKQFLYYFLTFPLMVVNKYKL